jgi:hypothetical protein
MLANLMHEGSIGDSGDSSGPPKRDLPAGIKPYRQFQPDLCRRQSQTGNFLVRQINRHTKTYHDDATVQRRPMVGLCNIILKLLAWWKHLLDFRLR